ncbi:hypothetical protein ACN2C7_15615 [Caulobacter sp. ErkDOM-E]|uniref:hypothetical protein n=1 Tax=Caulobacter sp. ErkDOM-E TaxID=3402778 RepID=UPI003AF78BAA
MSKLTALELAVAEAIARQYPDATKALLEQLQSAVVAKRDFTGVGFFTEFDVPRDGPPAKDVAGPVGHIRSLVGPEQYPLEFMLYVRGGYAEMIEAYSFEDGYGDLDLLTAEFTPPTESDFQTVEV